MEDDPRGRSGPPRPAGPSAEAAAQLAAEHGLTEVGIRPPLLQYVRETWRCRGFIWTMGSARSTARHSTSYLGQLWGVLNPIMIAGAYFLVFGLLLKTNRGVENFPAFLTAGIFLFQFMSSSLSKGSMAIINNTGLVRALQFPRCVLPLSVALTEFLTVAPALGILLVIMLATGEPVTLTWVLYPVAIALNLAVNTGLVLMVARLVNAAPDLQNFVGVAVRLLRYVSGVFFSIEAYTQGHGPLGAAMGYQPFALDITIVREALMSEYHPHLVNWLAALGWSLVIPVVGYIVFWRGEESYGRG